MHAFRRWGITFINLGALIAIAGIDVWAGQQVSLWALYVLPVLATTWRLGLGPGVLFSCFAIGLSFAVGCLFGHPFAGLSFFVIASLSRGVILLLLVWLVSRLREIEVVRVHVGRIEKN